jgi:hypothetical protein
MVRAKASTLKSVVSLARAHRNTNNLVSRVENIDKLLSDSSKYKLTPRKVGLRLGDARYPHASVGILRIFPAKLAYLNAHARETSAHSPHRLYTVLHQMIARKRR